MQEFYPLKIDRVFKTILLENEDFKFLNKVLTDILEKEVEIVTLEYVELPVVNTKVKVQILDVLVKIKSGEYLNVEVNINFNNVIKERNLIYYMTEYTQRYKRGGEVSEKVIQINLNFNKGSQKNLKEKICLYNLTNKEIYYEEFSIINVNLVKYKEKWYDKVIEGEDKHIYLVTLATEKERELKELEKRCKDKVVKEVCRKVFELNDDGSRRRLISVEKEQEMLIKKELLLANKEGIKEGKLKQTIEIARKMLKDGVPIKDIIKYTSLNKEEIARIEI